MRQKIIEAIQKEDSSFLQNLSIETFQTADTQNDSGPSLVLLACYHQKMELAQLLATKKPNLTIFEAAALGRAEEVERQLKQHPNLLNTFAKDGFTLLGLACFFGHFELVKTLLAAKAQVNLAANNDFKVTPLHSAAARKRVDIAQILLEAGADVNAEQQSGVSSLHSAANNGDVLMVQLLLAAGANVQAKMQNGKRPVDLAKDQGFQEVIQILTQV